MATRTATKARRDSKDTKPPPRARASRSAAAKVAADQKRRAPTQLTAAVQKLLVEALEVGCYRQNAAGFAGVARSAFYRWLDTGIADLEAGNDQTKHAKLYTAVVKAEALAQQKMVKVMVDAAPNDWRAAESFLSRRYPEQWGRKTQLGVQHSGSVNVEAEVKVAPDPLLPQGVTPQMLPPELQKQVYEFAEKRRLEQEAEAARN